MMLWRDVGEALAEAIRGDLWRYWPVIVTPTVIVEGSRPVPSIWDLR